MAQEKKSIRRKVIDGLFWTYAERISAQLMSLVITVVLARLIDPEQYGVIAIVTVFIGIADVFVTNGLGNALIQKQNADNVDFSTVFFFNIGFSLLLYFILYTLAPFIADFYEIEILTSLIRVMSLQIPIAATNSVQQAFVSKSMQFKKFFFSTLGGTLFSGVVGIALALTGYGIWALVVQYLLNVIVNTVVLWFTVEWRPSFVYSHERMKSLFSYGWKILVSSLMINIYTNVQDLIIGRKYSSEMLAYSNKGKQFPSLISVNINTSITKVLFPVISECQSDLDRVKSLTRRSISISSYLLSPILIGLMCIAHPFVEIVLTEKWLPCVPFMQIMCLVYLLQPIQTASIQAIKALGYSGLYLKLEVVKKIFGVCVLCLTVWFGRNVLVIIIGSLIAEIFSSLINVPVNRKIFMYSYGEQIKDVLPAIFCSSCMGTAVYMLTYFISNTYLLLFVQVVTGFVLYILLSHIFRLESFMYLKAIIKNSLHK